jgi:hypothetical protein
MEATRQIWLFSRPLDLGLLFTPVWATWLLCFLLPDAWHEQAIPLWAWVIFVMGIDVSHVWSTLFRTYLDKEEFQQHRTALLFIPMVCFLILWVIAMQSEAWFWRVMAYVALHHFVKQQYGFMALYRAKYGKITGKTWFGDTWVTYLAMLYPVVYWHLAPNRNFQWFIPGDFIQGQVEGLPSWFWGVCNALYGLVFLCWTWEQWRLSRRQGLVFPWGKVLWVLGTAVNWFLGIVYFNSDIAFTLTNVVAHGVPYMVLVFFYVEKKKQVKKPSKMLKRSTVALHIGAMAVLTSILAFGEEYLWDMLLNREKMAFFEAILAYPIEALQHDWFQSVALALLSVPQVAHYLIDGHIWKNTPKNPYLRQVLMR